MLPVTISLGLINFNLVINSFFGSLVSDQAPAAIDKAFRIYQLPQGIFSVAIATVLFPTLARFANRGEIDDLRATMANGMRQILFVLVPAAAAILVLSEPMIRLVYQRGDFDAAETTVVATALFWFAFSLPTNGLFLLLTRTFFSLQRPWMPDRDRRSQPRRHGRSAALALYHPSGSAGSSPRPAIAHHRQRRRPGVILRRAARRPRARPPARPRAVRITVASAALAGGQLCVWDLLDDGARPRPRSARSSPSASASRPAGSSTSRSPSCCGSPSSSRSSACCRPPLDARRRVATCWGSPSWPLLVGFAWLGASAAARLAAAAVRGRAGVPGDGRARAGAAALGRRAARHLRCVRAGAVPALVGAVAGLALGSSCRGWPGEGDSRTHHLQVRVRGIPPATGRPQSRGSVRA